MNENSQKQEIKSTTRISATSEEIIARIKRLNKTYTKEAVQEVISLRAELIRRGELQVGQALELA